MFGQRDGEHSERVFSSRRPLISNLLRGINFFIQPDLHDVKRNIEKLGGTIVAQLTGKVMLAIFSEAALHGSSKRKKIGQNFDNEKVIIKGGGAVHACSDFGYLERGVELARRLVRICWKVLIQLLKLLNFFASLFENCFEILTLIIITNEIRVYLEKTGNEWNSENFVKHPNKFYPVKIEYFSKIPSPPKIRPGSKSTLPKAVKELMKLIFSVQAFKHTMLEFSVQLTL
ncbi:poly [ADP-ribose] polymerase 1 [Trichinella spiralis]|uniref:poly [ADP-ribose] polymerase 1 n=1 Tax=Trichinella spiralis TaxID=6334 RepID=UPI0001EFDA9A|nr:poly [ADP-ribose] polymerase 1 [Trichinella spiralis]